MLTAWSLHGNPKAAILFVVEDPTINICDQRFLEYEIVKQNSSVLVIRKSLKEIGEKSVLDPVTKNMTIDGVTIGVIYFRDGYGPDAYKSKVEWNARLLMERSTAIKCPSIQYQLVGTKKIQQELARPGVLEMFLTDSEELAAAREIFTGLYSLDMNENGIDKIIDAAISNPGKFVLKPQREGGGNNMYDEDIKKYLEAHRNSEERTGWILMDKINAPLQPSYVLRAGTPPIFTSVVSELGIFGVLIGQGADFHCNEQVGHMLRTKPNSVNEAGVASGFGALDSVFLVD
jgi:glutathione synthase